MIAIKNIAQYLAIASGDGVFESRLCEGLGDAVSWLSARFIGNAKEIEAEGDWVRKHILDTYNWETTYSGTMQIGVRCTYRGEQCYFEVIMVGP